MSTPSFITFHGVGTPSRALDEGEDRVWMSEASFATAIECIADDTNVVVTIDDGNRSDIDLATPLLAQAGVAARFFVCTARLGKQHFLSVSDLRDLTAAGMHVGSHGVMHVPWRGLSPDRLRVELHESKAALEDVLGRPVTEAACPFGAYDRHVLQAARKAGYSCVYTSDGVGSALGGYVRPRTTITEEIVRNVDLPAIVRPTMRRRAGVALRSLVKSWR